MMTSQDSAMASAAAKAEKEKKLVFLWKVEAI